MPTHARTPAFAATRAAGIVLILTALLTAALAALGPAPAQAKLSGAQFGSRVVTVASNYAGVPYRWGGTTKRGFDCSGYTRFVYSKLGKKIPRVSQSQFDRARKVGKSVRRGDLVFFYSGSPRNVYHVGIYAGGNRIWHSPRRGSHVKLERIWTRSWTGGRY